jgi:predicted short-subunit dehydrogenase-like oxidoreductase (DUF2520 family)
MKTGFIGAGKVGCSLGKYLSQKYEISGFFSRNSVSAEKASEIAGGNAFESPAQLAKNSDIIFLTVPDGLIAETWEKYKELFCGKIICHCSGALSSEIFEDSQVYNVKTCSVHMFQAVSDKENSWKLLKNSVFTVEGNARQTLKNMLVSLGNEVQEIDADKKTLYHLSAVFSSNLVTGLLYSAEKMLEQCGFSEQTAEKAICSIALGNISNINKQGIVNSLTGCVERNDIETLVRHLAELEKSDREREIYRLISKSLTEIAEQKHPETSFEKMKKELY